MRLVLTLQGQMELIHHIRIYFMFSFRQLAPASLQLQVGPKNLKSVGVLTSLLAHPLQGLIKQALSEHAKRVSKKFLPQPMKISFELPNLVASSRERVSARDKLRKEDQRQGWWRNGQKTGATGDVGDDGRRKKETKGEAAGAVLLRLSLKS